MSLTAVGSIAFDTIATPFATAERELGGSAVHAALAAAHFTSCRIVGLVGEDFGPEQEEMLAAAGVDIEGIDRIGGRPTFSWRGRYEFDMTVAHTEATELGVFEGWAPELSAPARESEVLFLASMDPEMQLAARRQWQGSKWAALDSIEYWIESKREALVAAISEIEIVLMNDQEVRALTGTPILLQAAREILSWGPEVVVIKQGEGGSMLLTGSDHFVLPGYPLEAIADPTGSGDAFAGAFLGYLDLIPGAALSEPALRRAMTYASVVASFCVEGFGANRVAGLTAREIDYRVATFRRMTHFEHIDGAERRIEPGGEPARPAFAIPHATGGTPSYEDFGSSSGTPAYTEPHGTPGTTRPTRPHGRQR